MAKKGDKFKVIESSNDKFLGKQLEYTGDSLVDDGGAFYLLDKHIIQAKFKRQLVYSKVSFMKAMKIMEMNIVNGSTNTTLYIKEQSKYEPVGIYTDMLETIRVSDFQDLVNKKFYIKES